VGARGQFDVQVDGQTVATRGGGFFLRHFGGGGWPAAADVVAAIRAQMAARA
jgi:hypothetical protein